MSRRLLALLAAALGVLSLGGSPARATHAAGCPVTGLHTLGLDAPSVDTVDAGRIHSYRLVVPSGARRMIVVQPLVSDVDMFVCKAGTTSRSTHACRSPNMYPLADTCTSKTLQVQDPSNDAETLVYAGPALGPGTYRVDVKHCFTASDRDPDCDYGEGVVPLPDVTAQYLIDVHDAVSGV